MVLLIGEDEGMEALTATIPVAALRAACGCALRPSLASESWFTIHNAVRLEADDHAGLQRLIEYIARSPFSLARFVKVTPDGRVFYRSGRAECIRFPALGQERELAAGRRGTMRETQ